MNRFTLAATGSALLAVLNLTLILVPVREKSSNNPTILPEAPGAKLVAALNWPNMPVSHRTPFAPPEPAAPVPLPPAPQMLVSPTPLQPVSKTDPQLVGIVGIDESRFALIQIEGQSELRKVTEGEELEGWSIIRIEPRSLELMRKGEKKMLYLDPPT